MTEYRAKAGDLIAEWHDATRVCLDGFSCWVASVSPSNNPHHLVEVNGDLRDEAEARAWATAELRKRTGHEPVISLVSR